VETARVVNLKEEGASLDFLGFTFRLRPRSARARVAVFKHDPVGESSEEVAGKLHEMTDHRPVLQADPATD